MIRYAEGEYLTGYPPAPRYAAKYQTREAELSKKKLKLLP